MNIYFTQIILHSTHIQDVIVFLIFKQNNVKVLIIVMKKFLLIFDHHLFHLMIDIYQQDVYTVFNPINVSHRNFISVPISQTVYHPKTYIHQLCTNLFNY